MGSAAYFNYNVNRVFFLIKISFRVSFADFFPIFLMQSKIIFYYFKCPCSDLKFDPSIRNGSISVHSQSCKISYFDCVIAEFTRHTDVYSHELDYWILKWLVKSSPASFEKASVSSEAFFSRWGVKICQINYWALHVIPDFAKAHPHTLLHTWVVLSVCWLHLYTEIRYMHQFFKFCFLVLQTKIL